MRRANNLMPEILDMDNLRYAFWKASKGKRHASSILKYQDMLEKNLYSLQQQIQAGQVEVGHYQFFYVYEPKKRKICASPFREQVLHHSMMNICHSIFERAQIYDSYACRKGKGVYAALDRAKKYTKQYTWFLKLDVQQFFASIHHDVLKRQLARLFKEQKLLSILYQIIDSYEASPDRGLPIGNLTSQYFANHYLSNLDHYIKEVLRVKAYVRYMDDLILWGNCKRTILKIRKAITIFVEHTLLCHLKPSQLNRSNLGLPFLGYRIFPYQVRLLQKSKVRFVKKLKNIYKQLEAEEWTEEISQSHALPLIAFTEYANTAAFRTKVIMNLNGQAS